MHLTKRPIIFCGAGPGDPDLITVKGKRALERADLILYAGSLVPEAVLNWAGKRARRISSAKMNLDQIMTVLIDAYHQGNYVVRLHTGDPSLYGAIREQMEILRKQKIPWTVIPGVTAAFAAAASVGIEYTVPGVTQSLILTRMAGRTPVPEAENLESLARHGASMVIYLSMALIDEVARILSNTYGPDAPCVVAYRISHPQEKIIATTVGKLAADSRTAGIARLAVIMVGPALAHLSETDGLRSKLYDKRFSHGYRSAE
jgi:precorrin-4/cobalt-precorrin-4 C11-methyltransferase